MKNPVTSAFRWLNSRETLSRLNTFALTLVLSFSTGVSADDTELFFSAQSEQPNLLFILDRSGSMRNVDGPEGSLTRIEKLQAALNLVIDRLDGVNAGIIEYSNSASLTVPVSNVDDDKKMELRNAVNALEARGGTATQSALWLGRNYFRDPVASPIAHECQQNHIILMTDGRPTADLNNVAEVEEALGIDCDSPDGNDNIVPGGECGAEIGKHLITADHSSIEGLNNVKTHTIGFNFNHPWLATISSEGTGSHFEVESAEGLLSAFNSILDGVGTTFASPTVSLNSFNESRHRDELYYAQFQSSASVRWNGNIKKYRFNEITDDDTGEISTVIVDANDQPLVDETGNIDPDSQSFWSKTSDGGSIPEGGFAGQLPTYTKRQWFTDYNSTEPVRVTAGNVTTGNNDLDNKLPAESLGAADGVERNALVSWVLGFNVEGFDAFVAAAANAADADADASEAAQEALDAKLAAETAAANAEAANTLAEELAQAADEALQLAEEARANNAANAEVLGTAADAAATEYAMAMADASTANLAAEAASQESAEANAELTAAPAFEAIEEDHHFVADSLHNSPLLVSYWADSTTDDVGEILFTANNMGLLHAIDPETGVELWSYTPEEHLGNIKKYFDNVASPDHVYGLDGPFTLHTVREQRNGYEFWVEDAWLYMTERRGGNRVYALDISNGLTDPKNANPFSVMWKITGGVDGVPVFDKDSDGRNDYADLAQTWSKPLMVSVKMNCPDNCETEELLMFSGGYNPDIYDDVNLDYDALTVPTESHGNAIYFVNPETGELAWSVGNGGHHSLNLPIRHSIPSTPVPVDTDLDGTIDLMFFIDVGGDVWRVDFDSNANDLDELHVAGGQIAELSPAGQAMRFFNPVDVVVSGTNATTSFFSLVAGSGIRTSPLFEEPHQNRLYTIVDRFIRDVPFFIDENGDEVIDYRYVTDATGNRSVITGDEDVLQNVSDPGSTTAATYGFFRTFQLGEKLLQPTQVTNSLVFANSYIPPATTGAVNCNFDIGQSRLYISNLSDGSNAVPIEFGGDSVLLGNGLLSSGQIIDTGKGEAPFFLVDKNVFTLKELTAPNENEVFRRFRRTGWVELDEF